jgi:hypothetical protein
MVDPDPAQRESERLPAPDCLHDFVDALAPHTIPSG